MNQLFQEISIFHPNKEKYISKLSAKDLKKIYGKRIVVNGVTLHIDEGEIVGLLGPNGSGKTTSFYMIMGLVSLDSGNITLDDKVITGYPLYKRARMGISYLPQDSSIFRRLTVRQNIQAVLELQLDDQGKPINPSTISEKTNYLLNELQIAHIGQNSGASLSGGERRRVEIARTLATNPKFILLDEPFSGIDPVSVIDIQNIIYLLKNRGIGILITDHNVRETLKVCDRAYIISEGKLLVSGLPHEIIENETVRKIYLGKSFRM